MEDNKQYQQNSGTFCPKCGKQTVSFTQQFDPHTGTPIMVGSCSSCGNAWQVGNNPPPVQQIIVQQQPPKKKDHTAAKVVIITVAVIIFLSALNSALSGGDRKKKSEGSTTITAETDGNAAPEESTENSTATPETTAAETTEELPAEKTEFRVGETWVVEDNWKLTIDAVELTDERNQFDHHTPAAVYFIDYTYENINYKSYWVKSDTLSFDLSEKVIDCEGYTGYSYPNDTTYPEPTPPGAKCKVRACVGVDNAGPIKLLVKHNDRDNKEHSVVFIIGE